MDILKIIVFYGGEAATEPRDQLLNWLRTPQVEAIVGKKIEAKKVADWPANSGATVHDRVSEAIEWADKALLLITPDPRGEHGAPNVLEELGRWLGRKEGQTMAVIRHANVPSHSNIAGLVYIGYKDNIIDECREKLLVFLRQEMAAKILPEPMVSPPAKTYHRLVGRDGYIKQVMEDLRTGQKPIIQLVGLGGMGKTSLAQEVMDRFKKESVFDFIVWTSAKSEHFEGQRIVPRGLASYGLDNVLNDIAKWCNRWDILQMPLSQKKTAVQYLLQKHQVLVVLDNLETVLEQDILVSELFGILGRSKLLITSRHRVDHDQAKLVNLDSLKQNDGIAFLIEEGQERGFKEVVEADIQDLIKIHQVAGGAPLALKLVVGQAMSSGLDVVLETLQQASFQGDDYEFYHFIYHYSWNKLDLSGQMALVDMSRFPPNTGGAKPQIEQMSQVPPPDLWRAMGKLVMMSLVDKMGLGAKERYALHSLTQYFVKSDITKEWKKNE